MAAVKAIGASWISVMCVWMNCSLLMTVVSNVSS